MKLSIIFSDKSGKSYKFVEYYSINPCERCCFFDSDEACVNAPRVCTEWLEGYWINFEQIK